jgi:hypothetical protein
MCTLYVHVGYAKTATTTFQKHVFKQHPEIDYLGKFIPGFGFRDGALTHEINELISSDETRYRGVGALKALAREYRARSRRPVLLISTESLVHPWATDRGLVARRLYEALSPCRIIFTIREQLDSIRSFYGRHGRFCEYLFLVKEEREPVRSPLAFSDWLKFCLRSLDKNYLSTIQYGETIRYYAGLFGRQSVGVFLYEEFVADTRAYLTKLWDFLGIRDVATALQLVNGKHELPALSRGEVFFRRVATRVPFLRGATPSAAERLVPQLGRARVFISPQETKRLSALYADGNRELAETFDLPLKRFGYLM